MSEDIKSIVVELRKISMILLLIPVIMLINLGVLFFISFSVDADMEKLARSSMPVSMYNLDGSVLDRSTLEYHGDINDFEVPLQLDRGEFAEALANAQRLISADPNNSNAFYWAGMAAYSLHKYQEAIKYFQKAEELVPQWKQYYTGPYIDMCKRKLSGYKL